MRLGPKLPLSASSVVAYVRSPLLTLIEICLCREGLISIIFLLVIFTFLFLNSSSIFILSLVFSYLFILFLLQCRLTVGASYEVNSLFSVSRPPIARFFLPPGFPDYLHIFPAY